MIFRIATAIDKLMVVTKKILPIFSKSIILMIKEYLGVAYFDIAQYFKQKDFILFIDPQGFNLLKLYMFKKFKDSYGINCRYVECNFFCSMLAFLENIKLACTCKCIVTSGGWSNREIVTNRPIIQLWHGIGIYKKVNPIPNVLIPKFVFCSSDICRPYYAEQFKIPESQVYPYGSVVTDYLLDKNIQSINRKSILDDFPFLCNKIVYLWCPTFRGMAPDIYQKDFLDFNLLSNLMNENEVFIVRYHPALSTYCRGVKMNNYKNIYDLTDCDLFKLFPVVDVFMTDFSSSVFYAMILKIKICLLITDMSEYIEKNGVITTPDKFNVPIYNSLDP